MSRRFQFAAEEFRTTVVSFNIQLVYCFFERYPLNVAHQHFVLFVTQLFQLFRERLANVIDVRERILRMRVHASVRLLASGATLRLARIEAYVRTSLL